MLGNAFLYLWSLYGSWFIVRDIINSDTTGNYQYLHFKLFPIYLDDAYLWTIVLYSFFVLLIQCTVLFLVRKPSADANDQLFEPIYISHVKILLIAVASALLGYLIIRDSLATAAAMNASGYVFVKSAESGLGGGQYTLFQLLNRAALVALVIGAAVCLAGREGKYLRGSRHFLFLVAYGGCLTAVFLLNMVLGERSELVTAACLGGLLYTANTPRPSKTLIIGAAVLAIAGLAVIGFTRGSSVNAAFSVLSPSTVVSSIADMSVSIEWFAPHFSLYGAIQKDVPFTYGSSFGNLLLSVIPRLIWPDRPPDIYEHYVTHVNAVQDQGYAIHHATGWYLNFGVFGVVAGALLWGLIWAKLFNNFNAVQRSRFHLTRLFSIVAIWSFTADIPTLIRAGIEGYKPILIQTFSIPVAILALSSFVVVQKASRFKVVFGIPASGTFLRSRRV